MIPNHYRTNDEINGIDSTTYTITWEGGKLIVRHQVGEVVGSVARNEPITSATDSWQIAHEVAAALQMDAPKWVEHDSDTIYFGLIAQ